MTTAAVTRPIVETREHWTDEWILRPDLKPISVRAILAPAIGTATLRWHYGQIDDNDGAGRAVVPPLDLVGHYVRIADPGPPITPIWHGVITGVADAPGMADLAEPTGVQVLQARDLAWILHHSPIDGSVVELLAAAQTITRRLTFNTPHAAGLAVQGNRSSTKYAAPSGRTSYIFSADGETWTAQDIAEYALAWYTDSDLAADLSGLETNLAAFTSAVAPMPTVGALLDAVAARQRGHAWRVGVNNDNTVLVEICSAFADAVTVGATTLAASATIIDLERSNYDRVTLTTDESVRYSEVVVRGSPILLVGTFSFDDATLDEAWTAAQETAYEAATEQNRKDEKYQSVFTAYRIPPASLPGGPVCNDDGTLAAGPAKILAHGKQLLPQIPLRLTADDADAPDDFRSPLVVIDNDPGGSTTYEPIDKLATTDNRRPNMTVVPLDGEPGIRVIVHPNYMLGRNHYTDGASFEWPEASAVDYDTIYATVAWYSDEVLAVTADIGDGVGGTLTIDVPEAQCWYRLADTMVGVAGGSRTEEAAAATLRTDAAQLTAIAAMAKAWYGRDRRGAEATLANLDYQDMIGTLLGSFMTPAHGQDLEVQSVISEVTWDFDEATTTLKTDFAELDFAGLHRSIAGSGGAAGPGDPVPTARRTGAFHPARLAGQVPPAAAAGFAAGTMCPYGGNTVPTGWLICDGAAVSRTTYADLFTAIGTLWGVGDGSTTFNVPDTGGRTVRGWKSGDATFGTVGNTGGVATLDLDHYHGPYDGGPSCIGVTSGYDAFCWDWTTNTSSPTWTGTSNPPTIDKPDGSHEVDNRGPWGGAKWIIKT